MSQAYDYLVIGGGSGGIASAVRAASYGARCAVVESARLGGTCVNVGCVPKKVMWHAADLAHAIDDASGYGFEVSRNGFDWAALKASRDAYAPLLADVGFGPITTEILDAPDFYYAEHYHQQYLAKNPHGYCGLGGTGVSCPAGLGIQNPQS